MIIFVFHTFAFLYDVLLSSISPVALTPAQFACSQFYVMLER